MKVLLVDDSEAVQRSFGGLLAAVPDVEVAGCAANVADAVAMVDALAPDLVVLDVELRDGEHGIDVLRHVVRTRPATPVVVLSNFTWRAMRAELLGCGAAAYFDKANEFLRARDWIAARAAVARRPGSPAAPAS